MTFYHIAQICTCFSLNNIIISPSSSQGLTYIHKQFLFGPYDLLKTVIKCIKTIMDCEPQSHPSHIVYSLQRESCYLKRMSGKVIGEKSQEHFRNIYSDKAVSDYC